MSLVKFILFFFLMSLIVYSLYHGHYNTSVLEFIMFILFFLKNRYPDSKILNILLMPLAPVRKEGMLHSQYIAQLVLFNAKYIYILWIILSIMYYLNPKILRDLGDLTSIITAIVMTTLTILMFLFTVLFVINFLKYMYIKFFHRDRIYEKM